MFYIHRPVCTQRTYRRCHHYPVIVVRIYYRALQRTNTGHKQGVIFHGKRHIEALQQLANTLSPVAFLIEQPVQALYGTLTITACRQYGQHREKVRAVCSIVIKAFEAC